MNIIGYALWGKKRGELPAKSQHNFDNLRISHRA